MKRKKRTRQSRRKSESRSRSSLRTLTVFGRAVIPEGAAYNSALGTTIRTGLDFADTVAGAVLLWQQEVLRRGAIPSSCFVVPGERANEVATHGDYVEAHTIREEEIVGTWGDLEHDLATDDGHTSFDEDVRRLENLGELSLVRVARDDSQ